MQGNSTGSSYKSNCQTQSIADGKCDEYNNKDACSLDGGDCCRRTCIENCYYDSKLTVALTQLPIDGEQLSCLNDCGSRNYDCVQKAAGCSECYHGTCKPLEDCYQSDESVLRLLDTCKFESFTMGNYRTVDLFCGKDVDETFIHDPYNLVLLTQALHYPGCGLTPQQCTYMSCCTDAIASSSDSTNCNNTVRSAVQFDPASRSNVTVNESCINQFRSCFLLNAKKSYGQCCECDEGWTGYDCNTPICSQDCVQGVCWNPDVCLCTTGWKAEDCNTPICSNCQHGACIDVNVCRCFYGWTDDNCSTRRFSPQL